MEYVVQLTSIGRHKVSVLREVRLATHLGLTQSKALVETLGVLDNHFGQDEAEAIVGRLETLGATATIRPKWDNSVITFDRTQGADQAFVTISRKEAVINLRRRTFGDPGNEQTIECATADDAVKRIETLLNGRAVADSDIDAYRAMTARNPQLEARVVAAPNENAPRQVYGDWLLDNGDVRGDYLLRAVRGEERPDMKSVMLGPLADVEDENGTVWDRGLITRLAFRERGPWSRNHIEEALGAMATIIMREIEIPVQLAKALLGPSWPESLDSVHLFALSPSTLPPADHAVIGNLAERLRALTVRGVFTGFPLRFVSEHLEELTVMGIVQGEEFFDELLADAHLPALRHLSIRPNNWEYFDNLFAMNRREPVFLRARGPEARITRRVHRARARPAGARRLQNHAVGDRRDH